MKIGAYIERDIRHADDFLNRPQNRELIDRFKFDLGQIGPRLPELFRGVADRTRLELLALEQQAREASTYLNTIQPIRESKEGKPGRVTLGVPPLRSDKEDFSSHDLQRGVVDRERKPRAEQHRCKIQCGWRFHIPLQCSWKT